MKAVAARRVYNRSLYHDLDGTDWDPNERKIDLTIRLVLFPSSNAFVQTSSALNSSATRTTGARCATGFEIRWQNDGHLAVISCCVLISSL